MVTFVLGLCPRRFAAINPWPRAITIICDRIWENPPYGIRAQFAQSAFLVAQAEICQSPDFVIYMSNTPSSNCCRLLRRLVVLYEGEISLHFDPPSRYSRRTRSPLLWALIRILYLDTAKFIELLYVCSLPRAHAQGVKQSVCPSVVVGTKITRS